MRAAALVSAIVAAAVLSAGAGGTTAPLRLQVTFTGTARGQFNDVERWTSLETNQCVLRRSRDEATAITWTLAWRGTPGARAVASAPPAWQGNVAGTELRDSCDVAAADLPPDAPQDWLATVKCDDPLEAEGGGGLTLARTKTAVVVAVETAEYAVDPDAPCTAEPRSDQLRARVPITLTTLAKLKRGASLSFAVGSAVSRYGDYTPQFNCMHPAKPYDGYRSYDQCQDLLSWIGTLRVTKL